MTSARPTIAKLIHEPETLHHSQDFLFHRSLPLQASARSQSCFLVIVEVKQPSLDPKLRLSYSHDKDGIDTAAH